MSCTYTYKEYKNVSYEKLLSHSDFLKLAEAEVTSNNTKINDALYLETVNPVQEKIASALFETKSELKTKKKVNLGSAGDYDFQEADNKTTFALTTFVDSDYFINGRGKHYVVPFSRGDFIKQIVNQNKDTVGEVQAEKDAEEIVKNWDIIGEDSVELHKLLNLRTKGHEGEFKSKLEGTKFEGVRDVIWDIITGKSDKFSDELFRGTGKSLQRVISNILLNLKLEEQGITLLGHIDKIVIDKNGGIHIINYKVTTNSIGLNKSEKYDYELALLKLMLIAELSDKGIKFDINSIDLAIIPIYLNYSKDYSKITGINIGTKKVYGTDRGRYTGEKYDNAAKRFINPKTVIEKLNTEEENEIKRQLELILPKKNVTILGIGITSDMWIKKNIGINIIPVTGVKGVYYRINFPDGTTVDIKEDYHSPMKNKKIKDAVESRLEDLTIGNSYIIASYIAKYIKNGMNDKYGRFSFSDAPEFRGCYKYFDKMFKPYFSGRYDDEKKKFIQDWELIDDEILLNQNILLFRHRKTRLLDVITLSPYDLDLVCQFRGGYTNILGEFIGDNEAREKGIIKGTYGNIEMLRTMVSLNTLLGKISGESKLGKIHIVSPENLGSSTIYTFKNAIKNFTKIIEVMKLEEPDLFKNFKNNFQGIKFHDSIKAFLELVERLDDEELVRKINKEWIPDIESDSKYAGVHIFEDPTISNESKFEILKTIMKSMEYEFGFDAFDKIDLYEDKQKVALYKSIGEAILQYGRLDTLINYNESDMSSAELNFLGTANISSQNIKIITGLFALTADTIAERAYKKTRPIQKYLTEYYKACGYSDFRNSTIGDLERVFRRLFETVDNKKIMRFKNPYTDPSLYDYERKFLKQVLFTLAEVRSRMFPGNEHATFNFKSWNDPKLEDFAKENNWYLEVPLMRASKATTRTTGYNIKEWKNRMLNMFSGEQLYKNFLELVDNIYGEDEQKRIDDDFSLLSITNRYSWYESLNNDAARQNALSSRDVDFFESNVETLLMNFITGQEQAEEMSNFMIKTKAVLLTLNGIGNPGSPKLKNTIDYILKFLSINVYNRSVLDNTSKKLVSIIKPAKHLATSVYILGNFASMVRDTVEGLLLNFTRASIKFLTNISKKSLVKAYGIVVRDGTFSNVRSMNLLNLLNIKYRISNVDVARIEEVLASGRGGITNYQNWLYATLRRPDFMNRMTLLVAKMIEDGVWEAMSIDEEGTLKYNWKLDKRFSYYAEYKDKDNIPDKEKYMKQRGDYYSAIMEYNQEHTDNPLNIQDPEVALLDPYTNAYVESIKAVGNSIYGSYDKSTRSMWEFMATGQTLGLFTTWMNGMIGNYFRKPGSETGLMIEEDAVNEVGEKLFLDENYNIVVLRFDENGEEYYINENTGLRVEGNVFPLKKHVPVLSLGIIYSVLHLFKKVIPEGLSKYEDEGLLGLVNEINKEILNNPEELKNFKKLFSDLCVTIFLAGIFQLVVDPAYKDLKKNRDKKDFLVNSLEDILYKGTASSYDGFKGPFNIIQTYGNNNPPAYKVTTKMMTDITKTLVGKKTVGQLITQNVPVFRSFRNAYDAYAK